MIDDLERMRKETAVAYFKILSWYHPIGTEEKPRKTLA
jgi:hypothetical protein